MRGVPDEAERDMLSVSTMGCPPAKTRVEKVSHVPLTHGPGGFTAAQPTTV